MASVLAVRFAREIAARKGELLRSTRLRVVSFDSEEAGLRGAAAYMRAHAEELGRLPCFHLNFDSIYQLGHLQALTSDINGTVRLSAEMVETLETCARENGHAIGRFGMLFGAGGTDAAESARKGLSATTVIAMPTTIIRDGLVYLPGTAVHRKDEPDSRSRLHPADGFEVEAEPGIAEQTIVAGLILIQLRLPRQFEEWDELLHIRQRQFIMRNRVAEDETVFKGLQAAVIAGAKQR